MSAQSNSLTKGQIAEQIIASRSLKKEEGTASNADTHVKTFNWNSSFAFLGEKTVLRKLKTLNFFESSKEQSYI